MFRLNPPWHFQQEPDRPRGQCVSLPSLTPAGHLASSQMVREPGRRPQAPEWPRQCQLPELWPSVFWRLRSWQQNTLSHWHMHSDTWIHPAQTHSNSFQQTDDRHPIDHGWFIGRMLCATLLACLITLCKYRVCRAVVHMFAGLRLFLCSICPLKSSYNHSWT